MVRTDQLSASEASRIAMVQVDDPRGAWGVRADGVDRILAAAEWNTASAIDVLAALGPMPWARSRRVLVLRARGREIALVAAGALTIVEVAASDVLPLPGVLAAATPQVSAVVVATDGSLSLLIEPSAVTAGDTVVGEETCPSHS